ncbi:MAG: four helix bundle protein [Proteobacteria bacterium]|nr:four helix bundle protein [Pseudomonadota bacterium]
MFFIYAIESLPTKQIYIGQTNNIEKRLGYHNSGYIKSTKKRKPWTLLAMEIVEDRKKASWIEKELKESKGKRLKWIERNRVILKATPRREGSTSQTNPEQRRFIGLSIRSLVECVACLHVILKRKYIAIEEFNSIYAFSEKFFAKLQAFRRSLS